MFIVERNLSSSLKSLFKLSKCSAYKVYLLIKMNTSGYKFISYHLPGEEKKQTLET